MDLNTGLYMSYIKPNDTPTYINKKSNHPPSITKNIPIAVNKRLSNISANEEVFMKAIPLYQEALGKSGYDHQLKFNPPQKTNGKRRNSRKQS